MRSIKFCELGHKAQDMGSCDFLIHHDERLALCLYTFRGIGVMSCACGMIF